MRKLANNVVAKFDDFDPEPPQFSDPFQKNWDEVKEMRGLDTNFKRRTTRVVKGYHRRKQGSSNRTQRCWNEVTKQQADPWLCNL